MEKEEIDLRLEAFLSLPEVEAYKRIYVRWSVNYEKGGAEQRGYEVILSLFRATVASCVAIGMGELEAQEFLIKAQDEWELWLARRNFNVE